MPLGGLLGAASDLAHPDLDGEHSVGRNQPRDPLLSISEVRADPNLSMSPGLHPDQSFLDARNGLTCPYHRLVVNEDATPLIPEDVRRETRLRLSFVERYFIASVEKDSDVVRYTVISLCSFAGAFVILDHLKPRVKPHGHLGECWLPGV